MKIKPILNNLLNILTLLLTFASFASLLGRFHRGADTFALVVDYYFWLCLLLLVAFVLLRAWRWAALVGLLLLVNGVHLVNYSYIDEVAPASQGQERTLRLMVYNIYHLNDDLDAIVREVEEYDPDMLFIMEYSDAIQQKIESSFAAYPHQLIQTSRWTMGLALFSRIPFEDTRIHRFPATRIPIYQVEMNVNGQPFTFVGGHPWAAQPQWVRLHRYQMADITKIAAESSGRLIVAGDFNATQWSHTLEHLAQSANVRNIRRPFDLSKTFFPGASIGLSLDHVLISDEWQLLHYEHGERGGSDHVPIVVDLFLK